MIPQHGVSARSSVAPYTITTSTKTVKSGTPMEVVITGKSSSDIMRGMLMQARYGDEIVGTFTLNPNERFAQLIDCGAPGNAVTHKKHDEADHKQTLAVKWTPPAGFNGDIKFRATIVLDGKTFWVGVESAPIKVVS
ncbi:unnamed protein product [Arctia plantaginis]|uniref:Reelin domain-containing protein n=1 Tax=Arctia plantaginis TaxID=874455 RepID=A0A8S1AUR5_ARCPL|nr:unnamed protein product [Arctia plantaginis]CAB3249786.1 unnamed protein product [Arctia plantaginis]